MHADEVHPGDRLGLASLDGSQVRTVLVKESTRSVSRKIDAYLLIEHEDGTLHHVRATTESSPEGKPARLEVVYLSAERFLVISSIHEPREK